MCSMVTPSSTQRLQHTRKTTSPQSAVHSQSTHCVGIPLHSGDIIELPLEDPTESPAENATAPPPAPTLEPVPVQYQGPREITLSSSGSQMLLYFYTDAGAERPGFEIAYWSVTLQYCIARWPVLVCNEACVFGTQCVTL